MFSDFEKVGENLRKVHRHIVTSSLQVYTNQIRSMKKTIAANKALPL